MFLPSRSRTGPDKFLPWKTITLVVGVVLILAAYRLDSSWLVWVAIGVLALGFVLRFLPQSTHGPEREETDTEPATPESDHH
jgi:hypothetical protein